MANDWVSGSNTPAVAHNRGGTGGVRSSGTIKYGSLDETEAFKIQKKFLSIAKRNMIFARFAQKETKERNGGLEVRWKRFEKFSLPLVPLAEGVKPPADTLLQTIIKVKLHQYGSYVATTDVLVAAAQDPVIQQITERQSIQAAELMDFLTYLHARSGTQAAYSGGTTRATVAKTITGQIGITAGTPGTATTNILDTAVRALEYQEARKIANQMTPSPKYNTEPVPQAYVAVCHTDLRKDIESFPDFIPYQKYSNNGQQMLPGEIGAVGVIRFILTTQAAPFGRDPAGTAFKNLNISLTQAAGYTPGHTGQSFGTTTGTVADTGDYAEAGNTTEGGALLSSVSGHAMIASSTATKFQVYPVIIFSAESLGCVTLSGYDAVVPKVVMPQPAVTDPLGQSGSVGWKSWYACQILNEDWIYRIECACSSLA
jgi:N4-gp56 family major capsid protein